MDGEDLMLLFDGLVHGAEGYDLSGDGKCDSWDLYLFSLEWETLVPEP